MLKHIYARAPFPASLSACAWPPKPPVLRGKKKKTPLRETSVEEEASMISVDFATKDYTPSNVPFGFTNKTGHVMFDAGQQRLLVGLGDSDAVTVRDYRLAITNVVREAQKLQVPALLLKTLPKHIQTMGDLFESPRTLTMQDIVEKTTTFAVTGAYKYDRLISLSNNKKDNAEKPMKLFIKSDVTTAIESGNVMGQCINEARTLGNLREDEGIPQFYYEWIQKELAPLGVKVRHVIKGSNLKKSGLNLLYHVGKGSQHDPYLVVFEYVGDPHSNDTTALVGKGVTFDCGGLNIKPYGAMETMHLDMMGAATVMTTMKAIAQLRWPVNVVGAVGLVENAIGPNSYHPSSILTSHKGLTVEVLNTDAEGRLVLADMLTFIQRNAKLNKKVNTIIDIATLTGAVLVGLGKRRAALFSNALPLTQALMASGRSSGDELWPLPIGEEHVHAIKGSMSDLVNVSTGKGAGSCTAAAFLSHFIEDDRNWAHLDIAGVGMGERKPNGFQPAGAPGFGVQLLLDHLRPMSMRQTAEMTTDAAPTIEDSSDDVSVSVSVASPPAVPAADVDGDVDVDVDANENTDESSSSSSSSPISSSSSALVKNKNRSKNRDNHADKAINTKVSAKRTVKSSSGEKIRFSTTQRGSKVGRRRLIQKQKKMK